MIETIHVSKRIGNVTIKSKDSQYTMYSQNLEARSLNQDDELHLIELYYRLLGNAENISMFAESKAWSIEAVKEFIQTERNNWNLGNKFSVLTIINSETQQFMGFLHVKHSLEDFSAVGKGHSNVGEIAYILDKEFWGKGYGTEIAVMGKKFIKQIIAESEPNSLERAIEEIVATVHPENIGSKKILEKTLKHQEQEEFSKFNGQPRFLFYKPLKTTKEEPISEAKAPEELTASL